MPGDAAHASWYQIETPMLTCLAPQGREHDGVSNDTVKGQFLDAGGAAHASWCHTRIFFLFFVFCFLFLAIYQIAPKLTR
jgi:hypothetical protein